MSKAIVFSGLGHGGIDPGASGNNLKEKDIVLVMAQACHDVLVAHDVENPMSRYVDEDDPVEEEVREANASGASLAVDWHVNAGGGDGFEAYCSIQGGLGRTLAENIESEVKALGQNSRGVKTKTGSNGRDYFHFIRETAMHAIIIEAAFIDNARDISILDTIEEQKAFGVAVAKGILKTLGIEYKEEKPSIGYWHHNGIGWSFYFHEGGYAKSQWLYLDAWYLFNEEGYAYQNEFFIDDQKRLFYFDDGCRCLPPGKIINLRTGNYCELSIQ